MKPQTTLAWVVGGSLVVVTAWIIVELGASNVSPASDDFGLSGAGKPPTSTVMPAQNGYPPPQTSTLGVGDGNPSPAATEDLSMAATALAMREAEFTALVATNAAEYPTEVANRPRVPEVTFAPRPFPQRWTGSGVVIEGVLPGYKFGQHRLINAWQGQTRDGILVVYAGEAKEANGQLSGRGVVIADVFAKDGKTLISGSRYETKESTGALYVVDVQGGIVQLGSASGQFGILNLANGLLVVNNGKSDVITIGKGRMTLSGNLPLVANGVKWGGVLETDFAGKPVSVYVGYEEATSRGVLAIGATEAIAAGNKPSFIYSAAPTGWWHVYDSTDQYIYLADQFGGIHVYDLVGQKFVPDGDLLLTPPGPDHLLLPILP